MISYFGWMITFVVGAIILVLFAVDMLLQPDNPYNSLVTYLILPGLLLGGVGLILLGVAVEWRRRHRHDPTLYPILPMIDLNKPWQRRRLMVGVMLLAVLFTLSAVGMYHSYKFTESDVFCGLICHQVMKPEYTAYQHSPHARVSCTECHIGHGADWYVKSKLAGMYQMWAVLTKSYHLPITTPIHNLRPARETCEQCHWPDKFTNSTEKVIWHFASDRANTPVRTNLMLKVGGGMPEVGLGHGIHWHISPEVEVQYWARDPQRLDIPWVRVRTGDGPARIYRSADCPDPLPEGAEIRMMDCIDCHNRPSHIYRSPRQLVDSHLATGVLDASLPYLKRYAIELFERPWPDTPTAVRGIADFMQERYKPWTTGPQGEALVRKNVQWLQTLYQQNFFPEQKVDWSVYPNHIGHFEFPGCLRCHDGRHADSQGHTIANDCTLCHDVIDQAEGEAAYGPTAYKAGSFIHPRGMDEIWRGQNCTDCHGLVK